MTSDLLSKGDLMNLRATRILALAGIAGLLCAPGLEAQALLGTAFTYQGRLSVGGTPPTGQYDLQFRLLDASTAGNPVGSTVTVPAVTVTGGLFTVKLDFGAAAFTGSVRWLEIGVRPAGAPPPNTFAILSPRQELTPGPVHRHRAPVPRSQRHTLS
jgi:hypothetical protein